jgi:hypothetical protein
MRRRRRRRRNEEEKEESSKDLLQRGKCPQPLHSGEGFLSSHFSVVDGSAESLLTHC